MSNEINITLTTIQSAPKIEIGMAMHGVQGIQGKNGKDGKDAFNVTYKVGTGGVNAYQVVFVSALNTVMASNSANVTHADKIVGIATTNGLENENVDIQQLGIVNNPLWNLTSGDIYYLGSGGNITNIVPTNGFIQKIGVAQNATTLFLQIASPIILI